MGQRESKKLEPLPEDLLDLYVRSEFKAMASNGNGNGTLTGKEVRNMLRFMWFKKFKNKQLKALGALRRKNTVTLEPFVTAFKADPILVHKTEGVRQLFRLFDKDSDGWAVKQEIISRLEEVCNTINIYIDETLQETVDTTTANKDGKVSYEDFLANLFRIAHRRKEEDKKKSMFDED